VFVPGLRAGQLYGYRVNGPFDPETGLRFDPTSSSSILRPRLVVPDSYRRDAAQKEGDTPRRR